MTGSRFHEATVGVDAAALRSRPHTAVSVHAVLSGPLRRSPAMFELRVMQAILNVS